MRGKRTWVFGCTLALILSSRVALAYHPLETEDPGTVEQGHYQLELAHFLVYPEDELGEMNGHLQLFAGLAPGLELDIAVPFVYSQKQKDRHGDTIYPSGWGDVEMLLKWRFVGDGDGPFDLGLDLGAVFPSGMSRIGQGGEYITPWALIFSRVGNDKLGLLMNAGVNFYPEADDTMLYGLAVEYLPSEKLWLAVELSGETDFQVGGGNDPARVGVGLIWFAQENLAFTFGGHWGVRTDAERFYLTVGTDFSW